MSPGELWRRLWYLLHREQATRELEEEMRLHLELRAERERERCNALPVLCKPELAVGFNRNDEREYNHAMAVARRRFGNVTHYEERSRDMWGLGNFEHLTRDLTFALRRLRQRRAFTAGVVSVMAIGIGATTAMFSAVDAALLRPLPFRDPAELVSLPHIQVPFDPGAAVGRRPGRMLDVSDLRTMHETFSSVAAYASGGLNLADPEHPLRLKAGVVTANFFSLLGVTPVVGRTFADNEGVPGGAPVVVLSHGLWQRQFGGRSIAGLRLTLNTRTYDVIGVMPQRFAFPGESDLWIPMTVPTTFATFDAFKNWLPSTVVARMAPGITEKTASARMIAAFARQQAEADSALKPYYTGILADLRKEGAVHALQRDLVGDRRSALYVLLGATGLLLLIACVNVTNLLLSQATVRKRELAVRHVLGATRARLVRQLLTESVLLAAVGALLGVLLAPLALRLITALMPVSLAGLSPATVNVRVLAFASVLALATGIAFGLWPALGFTRQSDTEVIKGGSGHGATAGGAGVARRLLVSAELALTVMLLIGAGLMLRSFDHLIQLDSGMRTDHVGTLELAMVKSTDARERRLVTLNAMLARLNAMPGIEAAGFVNDLPLNGVGGIGLNFKVPGAPEPKDDDNRFARYLVASPGYFPAMGIALLRGRLFSAADDSSAPPVALIGDAMARAYWPGVDPVGRTFIMPVAKKPITVIGVVSDVRESKLESDPGMQVYLPMQSQWPDAVALIARGQLPERTLLAHMVDAVRGVDKSQAVFNVRMMNDVVSQSVAPRRTNTLLISAFAALALLLAAVGVYAVVSYGVAHRSRELGIRSALGATGGDLMRMISREMIWVSALGLAAGLGGAWAVARTLESLVYGVAVHDSMTFVLVPIALLVPTVFATLVPARRAMRVNPAEVMRAD